MARDGLGYSEVGTAIGESPQLVFGWTNSRLLTRLPAANYVLKLADLFGVDYRWLVTGVGTPSGPAVEKVTGSGLPGEHKDLIKVPEVKANFDKDKASLIVCEDKPAALYYADYLFDVLDVNPHNCRRLVVSDDSMSPLIRSGDEILIDCADEPIRNNSIYVIAFDRCLILKRLIKQFNKLIIRSDNPNYPEEVLSLDEAGQISLLGRVVERSGPI
jgi:phage repressor protein C with HTH and peptisase S24 domain